MGAHRVMHSNTARRGPGSAADMVGVESIDIIRHARAGCDLRVIRPGGGETFVKHVPVEVMRLVRQQFGERPADDHNTLMWPEGLVSRKEVDIWPQHPDIGKAMRRIGDAIDADESTGGMGQRRDLGHRVDLAHHV